MGSTGNRSLSKRVARRNCFKNRIFQLNGKANYGDKPQNSESNVIFANFGVKAAVAA